MHSCKNKGHFTNNLQVTCPGLKDYSKYWRPSMLQVQKTGWGKESQRSNRRQHLFHRMPSILPFCRTTGMALETVGHMPRAMGAAAFRHHMTHGIVVHYRWSRTEGRSKLMARGARIGTCHDEDKFSMRVPHDARGDLRESASMLGMTGQTSLLVSNDIQMEGGCRRHRAFCKACLRVA